MKRRAMNKDEMLLRSDLGTGSGNEIVIPEIQRVLHRCYRVMQSRKESGGPKVNPL